MSGSGAESSAATGGTSSPRGRGRAATGWAMVGARHERAEETRQVVDRMDDGRRAEEPVEPRRRHDVGDRPDDTFGRVDVERGRALEPGAGAEREAAAAAAALERDAYAHVVRERGLEVDPRPQRLFAEPKLDRRGLEEHAASA